MELEQETNEEDVVIPIPSPSQTIPMNPSNVLPGGSGPTESIYRSIIHFTVNKVELKLTAPWKTGKSWDSTGTGFYIGNKLIITNSHVVHHAASIRLERNGKPGTSL